MIWVITGILVYAIFFNKGSSRIGCMQGVKPTTLRPTPNMGKTMAKAANGIPK